MSALATASLAGPSSSDALDVRDLGEGLIMLRPTDSAFADRLGAALNDAIAIIRQRLKDVGVESAGLTRDGFDRIRIALPGVKDPARLAGMMVSRAQLAFRLIDEPATPAEAILGSGSADSEVLYGFKDKESYRVNRQTLMTGQDMLDAQPGFDQRSGEPIVSFRLTARGTSEFARITRDNIGRPFAIVLDNEVISAPVIREPILGGSGQISGGFTLQQANDLAILLRAGALPIRVTIMDQQTVEPARP